MKVKKSCKDCEYSKGDMKTTRWQCTKSILEIEDAGCFLLLLIAEFRAHNYYEKEKHKGWDESKGTRLKSEKFMEKFIKKYLDKKSIWQRIKDICKGVEKVKVEENDEQKI